MSKEREQDEYTGKLVVDTFYKVAGRRGTTAVDITKYLCDKFGRVWRKVVLAHKVENTLKRAAALGFLQKRGHRYVAAYPKPSRENRTRRRRGRPPLDPRRGRSHRLHSYSRRHDRNSAHPNNNTSCLRTMR